MANVCNTKAVSTLNRFRLLGKLRSALFFALTLLTGCTMVGPDFLRPSTKVSDQWLEAHDSRVETSPAVYREWWKAFNDPVLEDLIQTAYQQNLPLRIAGVRVFEARAQLGIAIGEFFPQVAADVGINKLQSDQRDIASGASGRSSTGIGLSYMQAQVGLGRVGSSTSGASTGEPLSPPMPACSAPSPHMITRW